MAALLAAAAASYAPCPLGFAANPDAPAPAYASDDATAAAAPVGAVRVDDFGGSLPADTPGVATTALEDAFFDLLWRCDSPVESERAAAAEELTRRFRDFETIWMDRAFLTDGEISDAAAARFLDAEAAYRADAAEETWRAMDARWSVEPAEDGGGEAPGRSAAIRVSWSPATRIVWLAPDFRSCRWRDPENGELWRPRALYSAPELQPDFDAGFLDVETILERVPDAPDDVNDAGGSSAAAFDALVGVDLRAIAIPVRRGVGEERGFRAGALTLRGASARRDPDSGRWFVTARLQYDEAFDAFDSHRVWYDRNDFRLRIPTSETPAAPTRLRAMERAADGERVELEFHADSALDDAMAADSALLECRLPRFFLRERRSF